MLQLKKENTNIYFVSGSIVVSLIFYVATLSVLYQDVNGGSSLKLYKELQAQQAKEDS